MDYSLNPYLFFLLKGGETVVWDPLKHQQFALEDPHFKRLQEWSGGPLPSLKPHEIDTELFDAGLLLESAPQIDWGWDDLSLIYHIGTRDLEDEGTDLPPEEWSRSFEEYSSKILPTPRPVTVKEGQKVNLPKPNLGLLKEMTLLESLMKRQTSRHFSGGEASLEALSTLLHLTFGNPHEDPWNNLESIGIQAVGERKTSPSQGGTHPIEAYLIVKEAEGLTPGVYYYHPKDHALILVRPGLETGELSSVLAGQFWAEELSFGIFLTARYNKVWWKYKHSRSYKDTYCDAGHISQTCQLVATALGFSTWITGYFKDSLGDKLLNLTEFCEAPLFFIGGGFGPPSPLHPIMIGSEPSPKS